MATGMPAFALNRLNLDDVFRMSLVISMREVESRHVHPLVDHFFHDGGIAAGRPDGADDLCLFYLPGMIVHLRVPPHSIITLNDSWAAKNFSLLHD